LATRPYFPDSLFCKTAKVRVRYRGSVWVRRQIRILGKIQVVAEFFSQDAQKLRKVRLAYNSSGERASWKEQAARMGRIARQDDK